MGDLHHPLIPYPLPTPPPPPTPRPLHCLKRFKIAHFTIQQQGHRLSNILQSCSVMEDSNAAAFVDHKETVLGIPQPHRMNASKANVIPAEGSEKTQNSEAYAQVSSQEAISSTTSSEKLAQEIQMPFSLPIKISDTLSVTVAPADSSSVSEMQVPAQQRAAQHASQVASSAEGRELSTQAGQEVSNADTRRPEEEKEVSEYCPGLAIRSLALEDFMDKRSDPSSPPPKTTTFAGSVSSEAGTSQIISQSVASTALSTHPAGKNLPHSSQTTASLKKPLFDPIEVERKFSIAADTEDKLKSLGAKLHKEKIFTDVYYDNDDYSLILSDCWLRLRNTTWEAKIAVKSLQQHALFTPATQYREITGERDISNWLVDQLKLDSWLRGDPVELLVQAAGLTPFAKFTTTRRSYNLPSCVVDLDLTDHGFCVGEIEVMAASPEEVPQALQTISTVAQQLGEWFCA
ncbi:hypothetical protein ACOMHN_010974 [Nucella lapillus]